MENEMEYIFIFDYYDIPLYFISYINNEYYLYYCIDDSTFFKTDALNYEDFKIIFSDKSTLNILKYFYQHHKLKIQDNLNTLTIDQYNNHHQENVLDYFPDDDIYMEYEYLSKQDINVLKDTYMNYINISPSRAIDDLALRICDINNSHSIKSKIMVKILDFINIFSQKCFPDKTLYIKALQTGSFKINFELQNNTLLSEGDFSQLIKWLKLFQHDDIDLDDLLCTNEFQDFKDIFRKYENFYKYLKVNNLKVDFQRNSDEVLYKLSQNNNIDKNIKYINNQMKVKIYEKEESICALFLSLSMLKNTCSIKYNDIKYKAYFSNELFRKLKDEELKITLGEEMTLTVKYYKNFKELEIVDIRQVNKSKW